MRSLLVPVDLACHEQLRDISREQVPDPFDRIIAASALLTGPSLVSADGRIEAAPGSRAIW